MSRDLEIERKGSDGRANERSSTKSLELPEDGYPYSQSLQRWGVNVFQSYIHRFSNVRRPNSMASLLALRDHRVMGY